MFTPAGKFYQMEGPGKLPMDTPLRHLRSTRRPLFALLACLVAGIILLDRTTHKASVGGPHGQLQQLHLG